MTRKKVRLAYIANDSARKATYKKRKKGMMKKVRELSTLCGVEACAIVYSPYDSVPEVWPDPAGVHRVVSRFKGMLDMDQAKHMMNQEGFLRQKIMKLSEQLKKQRKDNREKEVTKMMFENLAGRNTLTNLTMIDMNDLMWVIEQNLKEIDRRLEVIEPPNHDDGDGGGDGDDQPQNNPSYSPVMVDQTESTVVGEHNERQNYDQVNDNMVETMQKQQWFMDLMTPQDHVGFGGVNGDDIIFPFTDNINNNNDNNNSDNPFWSNVVNFFP